MGIQREGSQDSISALRRPNSDSTVTTPTAGTERSNPFDVILKSPPTSLKAQPILESPRLDSGTKVTTPPVTPPAQETQDVKSASPAAVSTASNSPGSNGATSKEASSGSPEIPEPEVESVNGTGGGKDQPKPTEKEVPKPATRTKKPTPKPLGGLSATKVAAKPMKSSPTANKGPKTPTTTSAHHPAAKKTPEKKAHPPEKPATPRAPTASSKPTGPSSIKRPPPLQSPPSTTGFVKPKVKSPTRPIKLPPSLTTHTTSSGGKVNAPRQSLSRASGTIHAVDSRGRPPSITSVSTGGTAPARPASTKGLKRQSSTIGRPRPSLGPPPKQPAKDHPPIKREKEVDEGFLARMMRPTQASASKTTEKVHTSPPRKLAATVPKKAAAVKHVNKVGPKSTAAASPPPQQHNPTANKAAVSPKQAPASDEVIKAAKAAQEVAVVAEQTEIVEQVIASAKAAGEEAVLPQSPESTSSVGEPAASPIQLATGPEPEPAVSAEDPVVDGLNEEAAAAPEAKEVTSVEAADNVGTSAAEENGEKRL